MEANSISSFELPIKYLIIFNIKKDQKCIAVVQGEGIINNA